MVDAGSDILISLQPVYADALLAGTKCVELRRRRPRSVADGARVWFYSKLPVGQIVGRGLLKEIVAGAPTAIWDQFSQCAGLKREVFDKYFEDTTSGCALRFSHIAALAKPIDLRELRRVSENFQPPQFFTHLRSDEMQSLLSRANLLSPIADCDH